MDRSLSSADRVDSSKDRRDRPFFPLEDRVDREDDPSFSRKDSMDRM